MGRPLVAVAGRVMRICCASAGLGLLLIAGACKGPTQESPQPAASSPAPSAVSWQPGRPYVFSTQLNSSLVLTGQEMMGLDLTAQLVLDARQLGNETELVARIRQPQFKALSPEAKIQFDALAKELERPFGFALTQGRLSSLRMQPSWSPFATSITRTLAAALQFSPPPPNQKGTTWVVSEVDATGKYDAEYAVTAGSGLLSKRKLRYAGINLGKIAIGSFGSKVAPQVLESKGTLTLGSGPSSPPVSALDYHEKLKVQLTPTSFVDSSTTIVLEHLPSAPPTESADFAAALAGTKKLAPDEVPVAPTQKANYDAERIGDFTFDKALAELEKQAKDPKRHELLESARGQPFAPDELEEREQKLLVQSRAFTALAALLRSDPKNIALAQAKVRARSPALRGLLDALASAGTPQAQAALATSMDDQGLPLVARRAAAFSLARTELATRETVAALDRHLALEDPLVVHALYGLGTIARRLRASGDAASADAIVATLVANLGKAKAAQHQVDVLRAIANSGGSNAFDAAKPFLEQGPIKVRVAALDALRLMPRPEVDGIVAEKLKAPELELQNAALDAISVRTPSPTLLRALQEAGTSAEKPATRLKAVRIMAQWLPQRPDLRPSLEKIAANDEQQQIRNAAKAALGS